MYSPLNLGIFVALELTLVCFSIIPRGLFQMLFVAFSYIRTNAISLVCDDNQIKSLYNERRQLNGNNGSVRQNCDDRMSAYPHIFVSNNLKKKFHENITFLRKKCIEKKLFGSVGHHQCYINWSSAPHPSYIQTFMRKIIFN